MLNYISITKNISPFLILTCTIFHYHLKFVICSKYSRMNYDMPWLAKWNIFMCLTRNSIYVRHHIYVSPPHICCISPLMRKFPDSMCGIFLSPCNLGRNPNFPPQLQHVSAFVYVTLSYNLMFTNAFAAKSFISDVKLWLKF